MSPRYASEQPAGFKNHVENIAIVGANGTVGRYISKHLIASGKRVTALTRSATPPSDFPSGLHATHQIDYSKPDTLTIALAGIDALIITLSVTAPPTVQHALIDAAIAADVPYIMPNEWGTDMSDRTLAHETKIGDGCIAIREYIASTSAERNGGRTKYVAVSCSFWYEFSLASAERYGFDFAGKKLIKFDDGRTKIVTTTWEQVGRAVAALFALPKVPVDAGDRSTTIARWENGAVLVGSFTLSQINMLESVLRVTGDKERHWEIVSEGSKGRYEGAVEKLKAKDFSAFAVMLYTRVFFPNGGGDFSHKLDNELLGLPKENLDEATARAIELAKQDKVYG